MRTVFFYVKPYKWIALVAILLMLIELFVELTQPLIISKIIDKGITVKDFDMILWWGVVLVGLSLLAFTSGIVNSYFSSHAAQSLSFDLRNALFSKIQSFTMATYLKFPTSGLITRLTNDVTQVQSIFFMSLRIMLRAPLAVIGSLIMAFYVNSKMALCLIIGAPIIIIFLYKMVKKGVRYFGQVQRRLDRVNRVIQEGLQAIRLVKVFVRVKYETNRFQQEAMTLKNDTMRALQIMEWIMPVLMLVMNISLLAAIWFGSMEVRNGEAQVGELVAVVNYAMRITGAFAMFSFIIIIFSRAKASAERIEEILLLEQGIEKPEQKDGTETKKHDCSNNLEAVRFEHVSFTYPNSEKPVLIDVSFEVKKGEKLAIMGATGSGKSTLLSLIPKFYEPTSGAIYVNDRNVKDWGIVELRSIIGVVPQQSLLFTGSIYGNVSWGKRDALLEEVQKAASQAQMHETVEKFPLAYETRIGQKGVNLSGGQKQRLSIARAIVRNPHILILDDSTSALDVKTESSLWKALEGEGATKLVVTQKIRTAQGADHILLLDEGRIVGFGTHNELIRDSELYKKIAISQNEQVGESR